jgi:hypothetical protein
MSDDRDAVDVWAVALRPAVLNLASYFDVDEVELLELLLDAHPPKRERIETDPFGAPPSTRMPATHTVSPYCADGWGDAFTVMSTRAVSDLICMRKPYVRGRTSRITGRTPTAAPAPNVHLLNR